MKLRDLTELKTSGDCQLKAGSADTPVRLIDETYIEVGPGGW